MPITTLLTDWNTDDFYIAALKGQILKISPDAQILDISHKVQAFNYAQAAFILKGCYRYFPKESIHIIGVNSETSKETPHLLVKYDGHYFISADNGIFSLLFDKAPEKIVQLSEELYSFSNFHSFPELSIFAKVACFVMKGGNMEELGESVKKFQRSVPISPAWEDSSITGNVVYIDSYKNAISNISAELFDKVGYGRPFTIYITSNHYKIRQINRHYCETPQGELLALFNSVGLLEIAMNKGNVAELLGLQIKSTIRINFE